MPAESDVVSYGPDIGTEADYRLCGDVKGKRVLELGCGDGRNVVVFAQKGAVAIGVEPDAGKLGAARDRADRARVKVELHQADLADLAFVRADSIDVAVSVGALRAVDDLGRVFRQVHRVLKPGSPFVVSMTHPAWDLVDPNEDPRLLVRRPYFETRHTVSDVFAGLSNSGFRVDRLLEPAPAPSGPRSTQWNEVMRYLPRTLIVRARKEGI